MSAKSSNKRSQEKIDSRTSINTEITEWCLKNYEGLNPKLDDLTFKNDLKSTLNKGWIMEGDHRAQFTVRGVVDGCFSNLDCRYALSGNWIEKLTEEQKKSSKDLQPEVSRSAMTLRLLPLGIPRFCQDKVLQFNKHVNQLLKDDVPKDAIVIKLPQVWDTFCFRNQVIMPCWKGDHLVKVLIFILGFRSSAPSYRC